jgi:methylglutaconyl-CoA hydratase
MPPRIRLSASPSSSLSFALRRLYSTPSEPLIRVTNLPAGTGSNGHIRVLELNRPQARNAISKDLLASLRAEIDDIHSQYGPNGEEISPKQRFGGAAGLDEHGPTRALILASAVDTCFCAGADLKERRGFTPEECV